MSDEPYHVPRGGLPGQDALHTGRAVFTEAYAVLPGGTLRDITVSFLPDWNATRCWIIARPLSGFAETFAHYVMESEAGGGSDRPEPVSDAEVAIFVTSGALSISVAGSSHRLEAGGFAYLPPRTRWTLENPGPATAHYHLIRKLYDRVEGMGAPDPIFTSDAEIPLSAMPDTDGRWATTRFMDPSDMRHDMHITIVTLQTGGVIPFEETHVMEHGLYVLEGKGVYRLNRDWVEVEAGDYMWLRAFCPQACYAGGPGPFRYLLYKDVNRHPRLST